jgi:hypothetical protein
MRSLCCLIMICLISACVPPKAILVDEKRVVTTKPAQSKSQSPAVIHTDLPKTPQEKGMRIPNMVATLPDKNDMTPTTTDSESNSGVTSSPPPKKPDAE